MKQSKSSRRHRYYCLLVQITIRESLTSSITTQICLTHSMMDCGVPAMVMARSVEFGSMSPATCTWAPVDFEETRDSHHTVLNLINLLCNVLPGLNDYHYLHHYVQYFAMMCNSVPRLFTILHMEDQKTSSAVL